MPSKSSKTYFKTVGRFSTDYSPSTITQYVSERTGMTVVTVDQKGPKVHGFFALATEIHDDSGAPHTLEHLCFMGSKSYRYKGVLDKLATRAYSTTNAWTSTDHTAYTLDTAGWAGFAQILPVYLEHVIVPTLTDAGCLTEVHHVDGSGNDAGVVYSEMQGVQNTQSELMELRSKRLLYPEDVGFRYETGGMMEQLRKLKADRIREFHREMYQPKNLCLIIIGEVDHTDLLEILDNFEETILRDIPKPDAPFKRPWVESKPVPPLQETSVVTVDFPEEDESSGEIMINFFGPDCNDALLVTALNILLTYLAGSSASVLENVLTEREQLTSGVYFTTETRPPTLIQWTLSGVATKKLAHVEARFFELLKDTANQELDMVYMKDCISRERRQVKYYAEGSAVFFTDPIIKSFLFDKRGETMLDDLKSLREYDMLENWTEYQWRKVLKDWMSEAPHVTILGRPSAELSKKQKSEEEARVATQKKQLGNEGLKKLEKELAKAKAENDKEIPREMLAQFEVPDTTSIHFINTTTARSGAARKMGRLDNPIQKLIDQDNTDLPLFIHFEHIQTNFVHLTMILGTESVPINLRPLLAIYLENLFNSPLTRDGKRIEFEQVIMDLEKDTISYSIEAGSGIGNPEVLTIRTVVEAEKYQVAVRWLKDLLWNGIFDLTRIKATTTRLLAEIPDEKRSGSSMLYATEVMLNTAPSSIARARCTLVRAVYLKRIKRLLSETPNKILSDLEAIRAALCQHSNFRVLVIANLEKLPYPVSAWKTFTADLDTSQPLIPLETRLSRLSDRGKHPGNLAYIVPLPTIDSSFALSVARGPSSLQDPRVPTLMVALSYLDAVEGPLWTAVRGTGLAYGTSFSRHTESGQVSFDIYRSPNAFKAFQTSKTVVADFVSGKTSFDELALEGAISSIVLGFANSHSTMASAAQMSFVRQVIRGLPANWNDAMLKKVREVTVAEIKAIMKDVVLPVFEPKTGTLIVTCAPVMEEALVKDFGTLGFKPEVKPLAGFQDDYGLRGEEGEGIEEEEEDEDEDEDEDEMDVDREGEDEEDEEEMEE